MKTPSSHKHAPHRVPYHGGGCIAVRHCELFQRSLDIVPSAVGNCGEEPCGSTVRGVVQPLVARVGPFRIDQLAFLGLRNCGDHQLGINRAPCKAGKTFPNETEVPNARTLLQIAASRDQAPGVSAVGGTENAGSIIGVEHVIGVARSGQNHSGASWLHCERADVDGGVRSAAQCGKSVRKRREGY